LSVGGRFLRLSRPNQELHRVDISPNFKITIAHEGERFLQAVPIRVLNDERRPVYSCPCELSVVVPDDWPYTDAEYLEPVGKLEESTDYSGIARFDRVSMIAGSEHVWEDPWGTSDFIDARGNITCSCYIKKPSNYFFKDSDLFDVRVYRNMTLTKRLGSKQILTKAGIAISSDSDDNDDPTSWDEEGVFEVSSEAGSDASQHVQNLLDSDETMSKQTADNQGADIEECTVKEIVGPPAWVELYIPDVERNMDVGTSQERHTSFPISLEVTCDGKPIKEPVIMRPLLVPARIGSLDFPLRYKNNPEVLRQKLKETINASTDFTPEMMLQYSQTLVSEEESATYLLWRMLKETWRNPKEIVTRIQDSLVEILTRVKRDISVYAYDIAIEKEQNSAISTANLAYSLHGSPAAMGMIRTVGHPILSSGSVCDMEVLPTRGATGIYFLAYTFDLMVNGTVQSHYGFSDYMYLHNGMGINTFHADGDDHFPLIEIPEIAYSDSSIKIQDDFSYQTFNDVSLCLC